MSGKTSLTAASVIDVGNRLRMINNDSLMSIYEHFPPFLSSASDGI